MYLQESIKGYEEEAEACLKQEFEEWLQGTHPEMWQPKVTQQPATILMIRLSMTGALVGDMSMMESCPL